MRQNYVLGFAFDAGRTRLVLIEKNRPAWQAGKMNGVGGKIEPGEEPLAAMTREFEEECGVATQSAEWHYFAKIIGRNGDVWCYRLFDDKALLATTKLDESVVVMDADLNLIRCVALSNVAWLVGIALDEMQPNFFVEANYAQDFKTGETSL